MVKQSASVIAGSVFLPRNAPWLDDFFQEVLAFPASRYSDQIDAFSQALNYVFSIGPGSNGLMSLWDRRCLSVELRSLSGRECCISTLDDSHSMRAAAIVVVKIKRAGPA
jgi:hypothetical protein